jgi:hypothetical protein
VIPKPQGMDNDIYMVICRACAYNPADRYMDPGEFGAALMRIKRTQSPWERSFAKETTVDDAVNMMPEPVFGATEILTPKDEASVIQKPTSVPAPEPIQPTEIISPVQQVKADVTAPTKKKSKLPVTLAIAGAFLVFIIFVAALGSSSGNRRTSGNTGSTYSAPNISANTGAADNTFADTDNTDNTASRALQSGKLLIQSDTVLKGDTLNTQFVAGGEYIFWANELKYTSSDESVAIIRRSKDKERFVVEGVSEGEATITGTYGNYTASCTIRVIDYADDNVLAYSGYDPNNLYLYMLEMQNVSSVQDLKRLSTFGKEQITFKAMDVFDALGLTVTDYAKSVFYYYSSENLRLGVDQTIVDGGWILTVTDLGGYSTNGELTVLITDANDEHALCAFRIPITVE